MNTDMRPVLAAILVLSVSWVTGCEQDKKYPELQRKVQDQQERIRDLEEELASQQETVRTLRAQLAEGSGIDPGEFEQLLGLSELRIEGMSGGLDTDDQTGDDVIVLYVQPVDRFGDVVKAPGRIELQLFDLSRPEEALFQTCSYETADLMDEHWYGKLWTYHYTLKCGWPPSGTPAGKQLTAKIAFTHALTGQRITAQKVVDLTLPLEQAAPASSDP